MRVDPVLLSSAVPTRELEAQSGAHEREAIESALRASRGRVSGPGGAAKRLGLTPSTLEFRIQKLRIDKFQFQQKATPNRSLRTMPGVAVRKSIQIALSSSDNSDSLRSCCCA